jgi:hypothetical protein
MTQSKGVPDMTIKTYALAVETESGIRVMPYGPFTLAKAESLRDDMAQAGKPVLVININAI